MKNRIITISREFGSGGRTIGKLAAQQLKIPCYDQALVEKIAEQSGFTEEFILERGEHTAHGNWFINAFPSVRRGGCPFRITCGQSRERPFWSWRSRGPV